MITAEQHYNEQASHSDKGWLVELTQKEYLAHVKQIQLDALNEGMRRAAGIAKAQHYTSESSTRQITLNTVERAILTAAERLTLKDL